MERGFTVAGGDAVDGEGAAVLVKGGAEFQEGEFGVVARGGRLGDGGFAFGEESGEKDRGFHLGAGHGNFVADGA